MPASDEVTLWIGKLSAGDDQAAQAIWNQYFERLTHFGARNSSACRAAWPTRKMSP